MSGLFTFRKEERLSHRSKIDDLFQKGMAFNTGTLRVVYLKTAKEKGCIRLLVSVPKRKFKKAVSRNRIKRLIREAYRLHKNELHPVLTSSIELHIGIVYVGDKPDITFSEIESYLLAAFHKLTKILSLP
jgi:ribonuclease P protein component